MSFLSGALAPILRIPRKVDAEGDAAAAPVARSRSPSPSAGSSAPADSCSPARTQGEADDYCPAPLPVKRVRGLPEIDYPSGLSVKNTFIDADIWQPSSLDGFLKAREIQSCCEIGAAGSLASGAESIVDAEPEAAAKVTCGPVLEADGSSRSRSTSAGCSSPSSSTGEAGSEAALTAASPASQEAPELPAYVYPAPRAAKHVRGLPSFDYPSSFSVKNTFIHGAIGQPVSLDGFYEEREIRSCPASGIGAPPGLEEAAEEDEEDESEEATPAPESGAAWPASIPPPPLAPPILAETPVLAEIAPPPPPLQEPSLASLAPSMPLVPAPQLLPPQLPLQMLQGPAFWFSDSVPLPQPVLGSAELPTAGSDRHRFGDCKPCAYANIKGCQNGTQCQFCHLCPPGELKRRQKAKRATQRALQSAMRSEGVARAA